MCVCVCVCLSVGVGGIYYPHVPVSSSQGFTSRTILDFATTAGSG